MDIEFHYYLTYLIAARAGFGAKAARTIAYACQHVDDNDMILEIDKDEKTAYRNYISQTMNILKPKLKLMRIYLAFHFVPGDPQASTAERKDGRMHWLNTTGGSDNARRLFAEAVATKDNLYRIGVACHAFADTWAHQNFIGYYDDFNAMKSALEAAVPSIGHAQAGHHPDWPALVWQDRRLLGAGERVDNTERFLTAAKEMFTALYAVADAGGSTELRDTQAAALVKDLRKAIGPHDQTNDSAEERTAYYMRLAEKKEYGKEELPKYDPDTWLEAAVDTKVSLFRDRSDNTLMRWDPFPDTYSWRKPKGHRTTDWYKFQEAVKEHQAAALGILADTTGKHVELDRATF